MNSSQYQEAMEIMSYYLNNGDNKKNISDKTKKDVYNYLKHFYSDSSDKQMHNKIQDIESILPEPIKESIKEQLIQPAIEKFEVLTKNFSKSTIEKIPNIIQKHFVSPGELIYKEDIMVDGVSNSLYLIEKGRVELFYNCVRGDDLEGIHIEELTTGQHCFFNESAFFSNIPDDFSARALNFVTLYKIPRTKFYEIVKECHEDLQKFNQFKDDFIHKGFQEKIHNKCIICENKFLHNERNCNQLRYVPNKINLILKLQKQIDNERKFNQYIRKSIKFSTIMNHKQLKQTQLQFSEEAGDNIKIINIVKHTFRQMELGIHTVEDESITDIQDQAYFDDQKKSQIQEDENDLLQSQDDFAVKSLKVATEEDDINQNGLLVLSQNEIMDSQKQDNMDNSYQVMLNTVQQPAVDTQNKLNIINESALYSSEMKKEKKITEMIQQLEKKQNPIKAQDSEYYQELIKRPKLNRQKVYEYLFLAMDELQEFSDYNTQFNFSSVYLKYKRREKRETKSKMLKSRNLYSQDNLNRGSQQLKAAQSNWISKYSTPIVSERNSLLYKNENNAQKIQHQPQNNQN